MSSDRYSRVIATLKIALPLLALGLLSTLFLISRAVTPTSTIPFADEEVQQRLTNHQVTGPYFSGTTSRGDQIAFIAKTLSSPDGTVGSNTAEDVLVNVDFANGTGLTVEADLATLDIAEDTSELRGNVEVTTSQGYRLQSEQLFLQLSRLDITSPDKVTGMSPDGEIEAGSMRVFQPSEAKEPQWVFTQDVKLLYTPKNGKE